ncbi:tyrosine-type recombinase/integrase [Vibrio sp. 10N.261.51.F12]|uniref:tyrosine-type recombinase/integrase n=1 Tax=Vibrio sp. 10N.261.51.F12 TaxID=3229679 RepID=UPI003553F2B3
MRYLKISSSGIWQFRYQISKQHRPLFDGRREIKKSLNTSSKDLAIIEALKLELEIRQVINKQSNPELLATSSNITPTIHTPKRQPTKLAPINALGKYLTYKRSHITEKTAMAAYLKCKVVLELSGKLSINQIRRPDAERVRQLLYHYPTNIKKHDVFTGLSGLEAIEKNSEIGLPTLSNSSVKDYFQKASSFFTWCEQMEYCDINPFKVFRFTSDKKISEAKSAYTPTQLSTIFSSEIYTKLKFRHNYQYWLPLLARYTGARLNELSQLYVCDVIQVDNLWVIDINDSQPKQRLKNLNSRRKVPLHPVLIKLGFIDFIKTLKTPRIFPELKHERDGYGTSASKWYGRHKRALGFGRGLDFHSFRHTFATELKEQLVSETVVAELIGHSHGSITFDRYGKNLSINLLHENIVKLEDKATERIQTFVCLN